MTRFRSIFFFSGICYIVGVLLIACRQEGEMLTEQRVSLNTLERNQEAALILQSLPSDDFERAQKGLIAVPHDQSADAKAVWDYASYDFVKGDAPPSVNPSLWRQSKLNNVKGLFKLTEDIYQLRGFDLANMTLIRGANGWIVIDPLTSTETARQAFEFAQTHLGPIDVSAIIFSHSHVDHFGGVYGVLGDPPALAESTEIIAPFGFLEAAASENMLAGPTMVRRADYMYGRFLERSVFGHVDSGLGKHPAIGDIGILAPTIEITQTGEEHVVDGVRMQFQIVSGSEAPAELTFYLPEQSAFFGAELVSHTMHNLYTLRGAKVRDALAWSDFIEEARKMFNSAEIMFASHHWPIWGRDQVNDFLLKQADLYKYIHDQTLRMAHQGQTPDEIAEGIFLPASLSESFANRGYYGALKHNARAVYQFYYGWFDGNPANLDPLPSKEIAHRYVEQMGGVDSVYQAAQNAHEKGDYRWASTLLNHLIFAAGDGADIRELLANTYEQMGFIAESAPWRDVYLTAAFELRHGRPEKGVDLSKARKLLAQTPRENFFDVMAAQLDAQAAEGENMLFNLHFTDLKESHVLQLRNSVLRHHRGQSQEDVNATISISYALFLDVVLGEASITDVLGDELQIDGSRIDLIRFLRMQDKADGLFPIVTP